MPDVRSKADAIALLHAMSKAKQRAGDARRAGAYVRAAQALERTTEDLTTLIAERRLHTLPGIGESIEATLTIFALTGETPEWMGSISVSASADEEDGIALPDAPESYHTAPFLGAPDLHCHTTWSDGTLDLEGVVLYARKLGARAIGISDHSGSLGIARGLKPDNVRAQWAEIDRLQEKHPDIIILKGTECDILRNGRLDHPNDILEGFDYVIASLHSQLKLSLADQTERVLRALDDPHLTILGHPTTRKVGVRAGASLDLPKVFETAARSKVALEVNGNPGRLDLDEPLARQALAAGARLSLGSDAHSAWEMLALEKARRIAAAAGAVEENIVNLDVLKRGAKRLGVPVPPRPAPSA